MSDDVMARCPSRMTPSRRDLRLSDGREHLVFPEQHTAAGRAVAADFTGHPPSIDCAYTDAAQRSNLPFRQKFLVIGGVKRHDLLLDSTSRRRAGESCNAASNSRFARPEKASRPIEGQPNINAKACTP
jgi:hypothetical protein